MTETGAVFEMLEGVLDVAAYSGVDVTPSRFVIVGRCAFSSAEELSNSAWPERIVPPKRMESRGSGARGAFSVTGSDLIPLAWGFTMP